MWCVYFVPPPAHFQASYSSVSSASSSTCQTLQNRARCRWISSAVLDSGAWLMSW